MQSRHVFLGGALVTESLEVHRFTRHFVSRLKDLRGDRSLVLQAVRENGLALSHAAKATWGSMEEDGIRHIMPRKIRHIMPYYTPKG